MDDYIRDTLLFWDQRTLVLNPTDLRAVCELVREVTADRALARGITLIVRCEHEQISADAALLQRLLTNLVNNAIDASEAGQSVSILIRGGRPGWVLLEVADRGSGMPAHVVGRIFEPYFTTKNRGSDVRGFGLGLAICRKIATLHHGSITVNSDVGVGTTVGVNLPVHPPVTHPVLAAPLA